MSKKIFDNLTGQDIKEMINVEKIILEELDTSALRKLMNYETDLLCSGEGDIELISRCSDLLDRSEGSLMSDQEFVDIINKTKDEYVTVVPAETEDRAPKKVRMILKRTILVAATIMILLTSTVAIAGAFGFDIHDYISYIVRQPEGTRIDIEGFTFYHQGKTKKYPTIEEMVKCENLDIIYPTRFPDGIYIAEATRAIGFNGNEFVSISTNDANVCVKIELNVEPQRSSIDERIEYDGITYYIQERDIYIAACHFNGNAYSFSANSREDLLLILDNIKE